MTCGRLALRDCRRPLACKSHSHHLRFLPSSPSFYPLSPCQVASFLALTRLEDCSSLSDDALLDVLSASHLRVCTWDSTLSLAHPRLSTLLDDLDERLRRFVRYYHLDDPDYTRKEDRELAELEEGPTTDCTAADEHTRAESDPEKKAHYLTHVFLSLPVRCPLAEEAQARLTLRRTRALHGEALLQGDEESEETIQAKKKFKMNQPPPSQQLVLAILRLQALMLSHCVKPHLFNSTDVCDRTCAAHGFTCDAEPVARSMLTMHLCGCLMMSFLSFSSVSSLF